ncbi:N-acetylmuramoyl-L-alanine amidase family protein [Pelotomaculum propionicicum]|uniref:N-acetylmuramoyl-L-alanine amidase LytC n=1 Tax=Pelotomaculum propionicicum TaxID=258475 RepID=A0A4Y7RKP1_9FIRM|nr:N-acetylmuramoyl-L-alanine amidase [Pelotomaculum propionicicum]NLI14477.1 N-acetylmuramoyl-L-alanine amidase [Peptococcaceae bacterium]TEB09554.1 N-acetylmuramoyl-L-alanine amidase LytC [Pelotomaculum propionicicum]
MSEPKLPRITNIWSKVVENEAGSLFTRVVVESTGPFACHARAQGGGLVLEASGVVANMPEGSMDVSDGLVREITLAQTCPDAAEITIATDHPAGYDLAVTGGIPVRTVVNLERSFLHGLFRDKKIIVDPGHGGADPGGRGPVNLLEKNVVLLIAKELKRLLEKAGAKPVLTRTGDESLTSADRVGIAKKEKADLFLGIHTHAAKDCKVGGTAVRYRVNSPESSDAAELIGEELVKKLKLADRGKKEMHKYTGLGSVPAVEVEVVTITNWVEEGLLRSPTVHKKAAQGIFNGVKNYFAAGTAQKQVKV